MNVFIEGDRTQFLSKSAVDRFKKDVKETKPDLIDSSKYLKEGYIFNIVQTENNITAKICNQEELKLENKRQELKNRLKSAQRCRGGEQYKQLDSLKRTVPDKIYKSYLNLIKTYGASNIPSPLEIIENPDKYRDQISRVSGMKGPVSNDIHLSNAIKQYFSSLGKFLCIEPSNISLESTPNINNNNINNNYIEDDHEFIPTNE